MSSKYPIPNARNLAIVLTQLVLYFVLLWLTSLATTWLYLGLLAATFAVLGNSIYNIVHEAEHRLLFSHARLNDFVGTLMTFPFPASFHLLRQSHLGHHLRNRSDDEAFDFYFDGENPVWKYLQLYGILTGFFWLVVVFSNIAVLCIPLTLSRKWFRFDRPSVTLMQSITPTLWRVIKFEAAAAIAFQIAVVYWLQIPLVNYLVVNLGFGVSWSAMQYVHHFGTRREIVDGSRNLWLFPPLDWIWLHHNWHHTHHQHPTVPWIYLPQISRSQGAKREFMLWHYLRMWRGPRYTTERVENRYAGRVIR